MKLKRSCARNAAIVLTLLASCKLAAAQPYPGAPVRLVIPYPAGSATDELARMLAPSLGELSRRQVILENRPGAAGAVGAEIVARAPGDALTLLIANEVMVNPALGSGISYEPGKDLAPVSLVASVPYVLVSGPGSRAGSVKELIALASARPGALTFGSAGNQSLSYRAGESFMRMARVRLTHVPYKATAPALAAVASNEVDVAFLSVRDARGPIASGRLRALAVTSARRSQIFPGVPTIAESGVLGYDVTGWYGVLAPARMPRDVAERLSADIGRALSQPDTRQKLLAAGFEPVGAGTAAFSAHLRSEIQRWSESTAVGAGPAPKAIPPSPPIVGAIPGPSEKSQPVPVPAPDQKGPPLAKGAPPAPAVPPPAATAPRPKLPPPAAKAPSQKSPPPAATAPSGKLPPPVSAPAVSISELPDPGVFWNSWVEEHDVAVTRLEVGGDYEVVFDLSRYRYVLEKSAAASTVLAGEVERARTLGLKELYLVVRPTLAGSALVRPDGAPVEYRIPVDLTKLAEPDAATLAADRREWEKYRQDPRRLGEVSRYFRAAEFVVPVHAAANGCAQVALSIWDRTGMRPLDHVVHSVSVGQENACQLQGGDAVQAGDTALLESLPYEGPVLADAALHIFDLPRSEVTLHKAIALFVDGTPRKAGGNAVLHAWRLQSDIGRYLADASQLLALLKEARNTGKYGKAAVELEKKLFTPDPDRPGEAEAALAALKRIAKQAPPGAKATVLMRVSSADRKLVYLPLSLLAASAPAPVLEREITVVHPSPVLAPGARADCIAPWTFAIPSTLDKLGAVTLSKEDADFVAERRRDSIQKFMAYLGDTTNSAGAASHAEGLVLLAHHDKGNLWFERPTDRIVIEDLKRRFVPGSVALLSACSAVNPEGDNDQWVRKISAHGVDAILASPFPVPMEFGVALAQEVVGVVREAVAGGKTPTVAELFAQAADRAADRLRKSGIQAAEVRLEFVLIGDHGIRMCGGAR